MEIKREITPFNKEDKNLYNYIVIGHFNKIRNRYYKLLNTPGNGDINGVEKQWRFALLDTFRTINRLAFGLDDNVLKKFTFKYFQKQWRLMEHHKKVKSVVGSFKETYIIPPVKLIQGTYLVVCMDENNYCFIKELITKGDVEYTNLVMYEKLK